MSKEEASNLDIDFEKEIDAETAWRKRELIQIKFDIKRIKNQQESLRISAKMYRLKAAYVMLYSHWEGCVKEMGLKYVEAINSKRLSQSDVNDSLRAAFLADSLKPLASLVSKDGFDISKFLDKYSEFQEKDFFVKASIVNTKANLGHDTLFKILQDLNVYDSSIRESLGGKFIKSSKNLLSMRNAVAHGNKEVVEEVNEAIDQYLEIHQEIVDAIDVIADAFCDAWIYKKYLKTVG
ncbi:MAE_28990/MAE_18760 family HEPN-like nuclease [Rothia mucilaginosa]|uniref:MAE_28990/MAE_18760 family HEPN-like nuclease n=1 Tax=Rothia mucilaginosa TaxID=43675 RepID=UPI003C7D10B2